MVSIYRYHLWYLLLGRENQGIRKISKMSYLTALSLPFRAQTLRNSRSTRFGKPRRAIHRHPPRDLINLRFRPEGAPEGSQDALGRTFSLCSAPLALFAALSSRFGSLWTSFWSQKREKERKTHQKREKTHLKLERKSEQEREQARSLPLEPARVGSTSARSKIKEQTTKKLLKTSFFQRETSGAHIS